MPRNRLQSTILAAACVCVVAIVGWRAGAESGAARAIAAPATIATVSIEKAFPQLDELTELNKSLEARVNDRQADLNALTAQLEELQAQLDQLPTSETEKRRTLRAQIYELRETATARANVYQTLINIEKGEIIRPLYQKLAAAVKEIAEKQGYDIVLFDDTTIEVPQNTEEIVNRAIQQKRLLYSSAKLDITSEVVLLMNQKYQAGVE
jgi:outer membrane protein